MKSIEKVIVGKINDDELKRYKVVKSFNDDRADCTFEIEGIEVFIDANGVNINNKVVKKISLSIKEELKEIRELIFSDCIFINEIDLSLPQFESKIEFKNCIFLKDVAMFGRFEDIVWFENCTFFDCKINFYECVFNYFIFNRTTLNNCSVDFQHTDFCSNSITFSSTKLNNSHLIFNNSFFPKGADLLNFMLVETDIGSKIMFNMVDFSFGEVRFWGSNIKHLEFIDCIFECNRFNLDCKCETLILQNCKNFKIISLDEIVGLKNLNILGLINTGRILISANPKYYINTIKSSEKIVWNKGLEYSSPTNLEYKNQLFTLMNFYDSSQKESTKQVQNEIDIMKKGEDIINNKDSLMKVFISYSWKDEELVDYVEDMFISKGIRTVRDKHDLKYRKSIKEFMKQIRSSDFVLIIISDNYLKSYNCMFEIAEFTKDENYKDRILPIIKNDAKIFNIIDRNVYINYWEREYQKLDNERKKLEELNRCEVIKELNRHERIMRDLPDFLSNISDMKSITCDNNITDLDFQEIQKIIFGKKKKG